MGRRRSQDEISALVEGYRSSGMTRGEYCRRTGVAISTLDHYRRQQGKRQRVVRVRVAAAPAQDSRFVLVLANGRRIESGWGFGEAELSRLIRVAEAV